MSFADLLGWCLAFFLPLLSVVGPLRRDQSAAQAYLLVVLLHIVAAAVYVYIPGILPVRGDANAFHKYALMQPWTAEASFGIGPQFYKDYLAYVYQLAGPSWFLGSILSIYAFAFSVLVFVKLMDLLGIQRGKGAAVLLFGALPTSLLYGTAPMREPYQVLFFMLACYGMLKFRLTNQPLYLVVAIVFAGLMAMLHKGLILYAPLLIVLMLVVSVDRAYNPSRPARRSSTWLHRLAAVGLALGFVVWMSGAVQKLEGIRGTDVLVTATSGEDFIDMFAERRDEDDASAGRTTYGASLDTSSPFRFAYSLVMIFLYYMLTPFPWQVRSLLDVYAFGEVVLRVVCLIAIFRMWRRGGPVHPQFVTLLMLVYFSMAFLWAAGTTNYGTATRHHMVHQWILLLLGVPALLRTLPGRVNHRPAQPQASPSVRASPGSRLKPRIAHLRSLVATSPAAPRLDGGGRWPRSHQIARALPRLGSQGLAPSRRLTEE